jgi:hypothetical protein
MNDPTPKRAHLVYATLLGTALALPALAADYRYPDKPFGLDSPAGRCVVCHSLMSSTSSSRTPASTRRARPSRFASPTPRSGARSSTT